MKYYSAQTWNFCKGVSPFSLGDLLQYCTLKIAGVGVGFSKSGKSESIFELEQFMGWSRNPK